MVLDAIWSCSERTRRSGQSWTWWSSSSSKVVGTFTFMYSSKVMEVSQVDEYHDGTVLPPISLDTYGMDKSCGSRS